MDGAREKAFQGESFAFGSGEGGTFVEGWGREEGFTLGGEVSCGIMKGDRREGTSRAQGKGTLAGRG